MGGNSTTDPTMLLLYGAEQSRIINAHESLIACLGMLTLQHFGCQT
jgi:hypothetical protein